MPSWGDTPEFSSLKTRGETKGKREEERRSEDEGRKRRCVCVGGGRKGSCSRAAAANERRGFGGAGEAGCKVEKTVSITPGTHRRIICWGWVNCDLRSVMTCNNFLSLLSVSRQGRSPQQGGGRRRQERAKENRGGGVGKQTRGDVTL